MNHIVYSNNIDIKIKLFTNSNIPNNRICVSDNLKYKGKSTAPKFAKEREIHGKFLVFAWLIFKIKLAFSGYQIKLVPCGFNRVHVYLLDPKRMP